MDIFKTYYSYVCVCAQSCLTLRDPMDCSPPGYSLLCRRRLLQSLLCPFSRQEYSSGLPFPSPGNLPDLWTELVSLASPALADGFFTISTT